MASILTNNGAMVALQTLNSINRNLGEVQNQISTGKKVANAKDNAAVFAISSIMQSDVKGFEGIAESLSLGNSTLAVGRQAAETVTELLTEIKGKIVSAQEDNVDRAKIQADVDALRSQIGSVIGAAQFNGKNLVDNFDATSVLSSLDRDSSGAVTSSAVDFRGQNLTSDGGAIDLTNAISQIGVMADDGTYTVGGAGGETVTNAANDATLTLATDLAAGDTITINVGDQQFSYTNDTGGVVAVADLGEIVATGVSNLGVEGVTAVAAGAAVTVSSVNKFDAIDLSGTSGSSTTVVVDPDAGGAQAALPAGATGTLAARAETISLGGTGNVGGYVNEGDGFRITLNSVNFDYVAKEGDTLNDVALGLKRVIDGADNPDISVKVNVSTDPLTTPPTIQVDNAGPVAVTLAVDDGSGGTSSGGLVGLDGIDVTTKEGAINALSNVESLIQTAVDSASEFGSVQGRVEIQQDFVQKLTDALKSGIGALVDANLEETSARLQALQVQQQLGIQSLSIANQAPQSVLSLFR